MKLGRILSAFALSVALVTPVVVQAHPNGGTAMFDDKQREFTPDDEKAWHDYLKERHKKDHDWAKANKREQQDYWKWRDAHRDNH
jgi:hypothetical protein